MTVTVMAHTRQQQETSELRGDVLVNTTTSDLEDLIARKDSCRRSVHSWRVAAGSKIAWDLSTGSSERGAPVVSRNLPCLVREYRAQRTACTPCGNSSLYTRTRQL